MDTGLLCFLLGITLPEQLDTHHYFGNIMENSIVADLYKKRTNAGTRPAFWYWQGQHGNEVDLLVEENNQLVAIEIKASQTFNTRLLSGLAAWDKTSNNRSNKNYLVYAGSECLEMERAHLMDWRTALGRL